MGYVLVLAALLGVLHLATAGKYTVTDEAWFEVQVQTQDGKTWKGKFTIGVFGETAPMSSMNFISIARGYKRGKEKKLTYANTVVHRIVPDFVVQMGDITRGDGFGGKSIYGEKFNDEEFILSHRSPGWVAMANQGPDSNTSQFFILLTKARWLDRKHVVFGRVVDGMDTVRKIGALETDPDTAIPMDRVIILNCGVNNLKKKYDIPEAYLDSQKKIKKD